MSALSTLQLGRLEWAGEHWVSMLREDGRDDDTAIVSHYSMRISPGGEGNVAVIRIGGNFNAVCTDNPAMLDFVIPRCFEKVPYWHQDLPVLACTFTRFGDATRDPGWLIESEEGRTVHSRWTAPAAPIVLNSPWQDNQHVFSILYFSDEATVELDGRAINGRPFMRDIWRDTLGGDHSSCVYALAESFFCM